MRDKAQKKELSTDEDDNVNRIFVKKKKTKNPYLLLEVPLFFTCYFVKPMYFFLFVFLALLASRDQTFYTRQLYEIQNRTPEHVRDFIHTRIWSPSLTRRQLTP